MTRPLNRINPRLRVRDAGGTYIAIEGISDMYVDDNVAALPADTVIPVEPRASVSRPPQGTHRGLVAFLGDSTSGQGCPEDPVPCGR